MNSSGNIAMARKQEYPAIAAAVNGYTAHVPGHGTRTYPYHHSVAHSAGGTMAALANTFGGLSMTNGNYAAGAHAKASANASEYGYNPSALVPGTNQLAYPDTYGMTVAGNHSGALSHHAGVYPTHIAHYMQQAGFHGYLASTDNAPLGPNWTPRVASGEMPTMITPRRDSVSSNEQDVPGTPYSYGNSGVAVFDRSPSGVFTHSATPSPSSMMPMQGHGAMSKQNPPALSQVPLAIQLLVQKEPTIPRAIPAPSSPAKPLDRSLENKNGETNVYIRGLHPETTDEMLQQWGRRFGEIQSSKSIIDMRTNLCKGFGFIKYFNYSDAEQCIRGFHYLGYEVSFARESFYAKLKKFADENNTNLYVSNIPRSANEHELSEVFKPHKVVSCRILRDAQGNGRGVGFARFESREACEEVIKKFNNTTIKRPGCEDHVIQIRYSDTHEQKVLKQQTAAARQFRAAEFEYGVMQARSNGSLPTIQTSGSATSTIQAASSNGVSTASDKTSTTATTTGVRVKNDAEPVMCASPTKSAPIVTSALPEAKA